MSSISRRNFIKKTGALSLLAGAMPAALSASAPQGKAGKRVGKQPRVIFMVTDGMSSGLLPMTDLLRQHLHGRESTWTRLMRGPRSKVYQGLMDMSSATGSVTDSSAASSSWSIGTRIANGALNVTPDGKRPKPILQRVREKGLRGGLVSTARITHATPAGFLATHESRNAEDSIAEQYLERGADVLLGGGARHFTAEDRADNTDLLAKFRTEGYHVARTRAELAQSREGAAMLGLFGADHLPYTIDHIHDPDLKRDVPTLAEMTQQALGLLGKDGRGFLLQVEAARVDHGAHDNDLPATLFDQLAFDEALDVALAFREANPETVIIVTTDHGNANPALDGQGHFYRRSNEHFARNFNAKGSYQRLWQQISRLTDKAAIGNLIARQSGIELSVDDLGLVQRAIAGEPINATRQIAFRVNALASVLSNYNGVGWTSGSHTADYSPLTIVGPGTDDLPTFIANTDLCNWMVQYFGV